MEAILGTMSLSARIFDAEADSVRITLTPHRPLDDVQHAVVDALRQLADRLDSRAPLCDGANTYLVDVAVN